MFPCKHCNKTFTDPYKLVEHVKSTPLMTCEVCPNQGHNYVKHMTILMCPTCLEKETKLQAENMTHAAQEARVEASAEQTQKGIDEIIEVNEILKASKAIDYAVQVRSDVFNAQTMAAMELKKAIDEDPQIPADKKAYAWAKVISERIKQFSKAIFDRNMETQEKNIIDVNNQRALQQILSSNELINKLRPEERAELQASNFSYRPAPHKPAKKPPVSKKAPKFDKDEVNKWAVLTGMPASTIQSICVARNMTPEQAGRELMKNMGKELPEKV